jgi:LPS export ABC transporter protein LptC
MRRTALIWSVLLAALAAGAWALARATVPDTGPMRYADGGSRFVIRRPHLREIGRDGVHVIAESREARYAPESDTVTADEMHGFILRDGRRTEIWAAQGAYHTASTTATLTGGVRMQNDAGFSFRTGAAEYRHDLRRLTADGDFTADGEGISLHGRGLEYDVVSDTFRVRENVGAKIERFRL